MGPLGPRCYNGHILFIYDFESFMLKLNPHHALPAKVFLKRLFRNFLFGIIIIGVSLSLGMLGYHHLEGLPWVDAFMNASMILSGMGPVATLATDAGKVFAGFYALFSGTIFLVVVAIVFSPLIHWFFHKFHLMENKE